MRHYSIIVADPENIAIEGLLLTLVQQYHDQFAVYLPGEDAKQWMTSFRNQLDLHEIPTLTAAPNQVDLAKLGGDYFIWLSADDRLAPHFLTELERSLDRKTSEVLTCPVTADENHPWLNYSF